MIASERFLRYLLCIYIHIPSQPSFQLSFSPSDYYFNCSKQERKKESLNTTHFFQFSFMHLQIYALILVLCCSGTALTTALPQQSFNSGQNPEDIFSAYSSIPQDKWPRYKGQVIDPRCILNNLGKKHHKREWPRIPQPVYPSGYCPAWQQQTETETDREDRELCGDGFEPRCCAGEATGFGLGTMRSPCYQCTYAGQPFSIILLSRPSWGGGGKEGGQNLFLMNSAVG